MRRALLGVIGLAALAFLLFKLAPSGPAPAPPAMPTPRANPSSAPPPAPSPAAVPSAATARETPRIAAENEVDVVGRVLDEHRFPVPGAALEVHRTGLETLRGTSGPDGRFRVQGLSRPPKPGWQEIGVLARAPDGRSGMNSGFLSADTGAEVDVRAIVVGATVAAAFRVTDGGSPVPGARVQVSRVSGGMCGAVAGPDGVARLSLPKGAWSILAVAEQPLRAGRLDAVLDADARDPVEVPIQPARTIEVLVVGTGSGTPVPGATFRVRVQKRGPGFRMSVDPGPLPAVAPTDAEGRTRVEGTCPGDSVEFAEVRAPGWYPSSSRQSITVKPDETRARIELLPSRVLRFPVEAGELPVPADGTAVALAPMAGSGGPDPVGPARMEGTFLVVENATSGFFMALAKAPDGSLANLWADDKGGEPKAVSFTRPRTVEVLVKGADGAPAAGVPVAIRNQGNNPLAPVASTDAAGTVRFEGLYGGAGGWGRGEAYLLPRGQTQAWGGRPAGSFDLATGDAHIEATQPPLREYLAAVTVDGKPGLTGQMGLTVNGTYVQDVVEDPAAGTLRGEVPVDPAATEIRATLQALPFLPATAIVSPVPAEGPIPLRLDLQSGGVFLVAVRPPADGTYRLRLESHSAERGWIAHHSPGAGPLAGLLAPGPDGLVHNEPLAAGRYRMVESWTDAATEEVEVRPGAEPARGSLDLSRQGWATGTLQVPEGSKVQDARILVEVEGLPSPRVAPGMSMEGGRQQRTMPDGTFRVRIPGDRPVTLRPWHPVLTPATDGGAVRLVEPRGDLVLRLVAGARATFRVDPAPKSQGFMGIGPRVLLYRGEPAGEPVAEHALVQEGDRFSFGGFEPGTWTLWIDAGAGAPAILREARLGDAATDLGTVSLAEGSRLRLRVRVKDGLAVPRMSLSAAREEAPKYTRWASSSGEGEVVLAGLGPGRFRIHASPAMMIAPGGTGSIDETREVDGASEVVLDLDLR